MFFKAIIWFFKIYSRFAFRCINAAALKFFGISLKCFNWERWRIFELCETFRTNLKCCKWKWNAPVQFYLTLAIWWSTVFSQLLTQVAWIALYPSCAELKGRVILIVQHVAYSLTAEKLDLDMDKYHKMTLKGSKRNWMLTELYLNDKFQVINCASLALISNSSQSQRTASLDIQLFSILVAECWVWPLSSPMCCLFAEKGRY